MKNIYFVDYTYNMLDIRLEMELFMQLIEYSIFDYM
jgi:hypothetical protein